MDSKDDTIKIQTNQVPTSCFAASEGEHARHSESWWTWDSHEPLIHMQAKQRAWDLMWNLLFPIFCGPA